MAEHTNTNPGFDFDSQSRVVLDPTTNVRELLDSVSEHSREILKLHTERSDDLRIMSENHVNEILNLRTHFTEKLAGAESARLDAILERVSESAQLIASAAETRATTLGQQVAVTAQASNETLDRRFGPIQASIEEIRKFQFETQGGRVQVHDDRAKSGNMGMWVGVGVALFIGFNTLLLSAAGIIISIIYFKG